MTEIQFKSTMTVDLIDRMGSDYSVVRAARVSTKGDQDHAASQLTAMGEAGAADAGLIRYLMRSRHGSPFEHNAFTFFVSAPIFVWREFMRHRIGVSYNEESGRYKQLDPVFYVPAEDRNLVQVGKAGHYSFVPGGADQYGEMRHSLRATAGYAYAAYEFQLANGIAREVARMCLPVNIYSSAYVTMNARSIMSFLSLRTKREGSTFPSFPQREIELVAEQIESAWAKFMPVTAAAFTEFGRVSP